jgi:murein DD-endopeptidase MepM/ murein hydrolase activator NlpD
MSTQTWLSPGAAAPLPGGQEPVPWQGLARRLALYSADLPSVSRQSGHLVVLLLLFGALWLVSPLSLQSPRLALPDVPAPESGDRTEAAGSEPVALSADATTASAHTQYLERSAVPLTVRAVREVPPVSMPQRQVRTSVIVYTVQAGDTPLGIAERFGLKGTSLLWANPALADNPDFLRIGQQLNILPVDGAYHIVTRGETIQSIASTYKVDPSVITGYAGNGLTEGAPLEVGQALIIPGGVKPYVPKRTVATTTANVPAPRDAAVGSGRFAWPMSGRITQRFWTGHNGLDIAAKQGTPIVASDSGYVAVLQSSRTGYGNMIVIDHGNGYQTRYAHLSAFYVEAGQSVNRGDTIGLCGSTGNSTGPHVHFEVIVNGVRRDPLSYLP